MTSGIYQIRNVLNNKTYIGSSKNIERRWKEHKMRLKYNKHHSMYLQRAYNKYGIQNFTYEIILICEPTKSILHQNEEKFIKEFSPEYNIGLVGGGYIISEHPNSKEIKRKLSEKQKIIYQNLTIEEKQKRNFYKNGQAWRFCEKCGKKCRHQKNRASKTCSKCYDRSIIKSKPVRINGITYKSQAEAARILNINKMTLNSRFKSGKAGYEYL